jgi:hypothetical protein
MDYHLMLYFTCIGEYDQDSLVATCLISVSLIKKSIKVY